MVTTDLSAKIKEIDSTYHPQKLIEIMNSEAIMNLMWAVVERAGELYTSPNSTERACGEFFFTYAVNSRDRDLVTYACRELMKAGKTAADIKSEFYTGPELPDYQYLGYFFACGSFSGGVSEEGYL